MYQRGLATNAPKYTAASLGVHQGAWRNMQAIREADACHEYLSQLVDRFCAEYGRGSPLAVWALGALSTSVAHRTTGNASSGLPEETTQS